MPMHYKLFGRTGLRVSELCLGAMTFGDAYEWSASKDECARIVDAFTEAGGNFIDTANYYSRGQSERIVGELIAGDRDEVFACDASGRPKQRRHPSQEPSTIA